MFQTLESASQGEAQGIVGRLWDGKAFRIITRKARFGCDKVQSAFARALSNTVRRLGDGRRLLQPFGRDKDCNCHQSKSQGTDYPDR
jgi:hypothetical protein